MSDDDLIRRGDALKLLADGCYDPFIVRSIAALPAVTPKVVIQPDRDTFDAMCAMRDAINEHIPVPSLESDLLQGPQNSVFCATVAEAVIAEVTRLRALPASAEAAKAALKEAVGLIKGWYHWDDERQLRGGAPSNYTEAARAFLAKHGEQR
jgi:hypothetical protein